MISSTFLRRELAVASRRLTIAFRINRRLMRLRAENSDVALPSALECRQLIENRTAEYLAVLTRYRITMEGALLRGRKPIAARMGSHSRNRRRLLHGLGVRWPASYNSALTRGKQRLA